MKKKRLSFKVLLEDVDKDLEDFSSQMEDVDEKPETPQQKAQRLQTNAQTPQQVQNTKGFADDDLYAKKEMRPANTILGEWGVDPNQFSTFVNGLQSSSRPMTVADIQSLTSFANGDLDNFMLDVQENMPAVYNLFLNAGYQNALNGFSNSLPPAAGKKMGQLPQGQPRPDANAWAAMGKENPNMQQNPNIAYEKTKKRKW